MNFQGFLFFFFFVLFFQIVLTDTIFLTKHISQSIAAHFREQERKQ